MEHENIFQLFVLVLANIYFFQEKIYQLKMATSFSGKNRFKLDDYIFIVGIYILNKIAADIFPRLTEILFFTGIAQLLLVIVVAIALKTKGKFFEETEAN